MLTVIGIDGEKIRSGRPEATTSWAAWIGIGRWPITWPKSFMPIAA